MKGYFDRIEDGGKAVILLEEQDFEIILPLINLPKESKEGSWFQISEENGDFTFVLDEDVRNCKEKLANEMISKVRMKSRGSKYKR